MPHFEFTGHTTRFGWTRPRSRQFRSRATCSPRVRRETTHFCWLETLFHRATCCGSRERHFGLVWGRRSKRGCWLLAIGCSVLGSNGRRWLNAYDREATTTAVVDGLETQFL